MGIPRESTPIVFCEAFSGSGFRRRAVLLLGRRRTTTPSLARLAQHPNFQALEKRLYSIELHCSDQWQSFLCDAAEWKSGLKTESQSN